MKFDIAQYEHKELREEISAQVACHISVTFTCQNNSRLTLAPTSASSLCLSHALCVDSEGNLLTNIADKASLAESVCVCWWWKWTVFPLFRWAVYLEMRRKTYCVSKWQWHCRPGTRWRNIHFNILFLCHCTETMKLIVSSVQIHTLLLNV